MSSLDNIRSHFPILKQKVHGQELVYLDNGASTQRAIEVIEAVDQYEKTIHSNVHRGVHHLSALATDAMEKARKKIQRFLNAMHDCEIILTSGTTHAINTVARGCENVFVKQGDVVLISEMEHHSNIVPWQMLCERVGSILKIIPITDSGEIDLNRYKAMLSDKVKLVSIPHVSNSLGTVNPVKEMTALAHGVGALMMIDGAQAVAHRPVDVQDIGCDFYAFSGHKIFAPTGTGVLYGKENLLDQLNPLFGGGEMIKSVSFEKTTYNELPFKFEAGTPNISGNIGLGAAIDFVSALNWKEVMAHEQKLLSATIIALSQIDDMRFIGEPKDRSGVVSFLVGDIHPFDVGTLVDKLGIAVRTGHHCTEPLMNRLSIPGTVRASFSIYNTLDEVEKLKDGLDKILSMLR